MANNNNKETKLPRKSVIDRQKERVQKILEVEKETLELEDGELDQVRGGAARYGLPTTYTDC